MAFSSSNEIDIDADIVRGVSLDSIRLINTRFRRQYGPPILAIDSTKSSWRKTTFPYYKANRQKTRNESSIDWSELFRQINTIKLEIKEVFPYKVLEIDHAEADDIIGVLARKAIRDQEDCMIVSRDKDFVQLQIDNTFVQQWDKKNDKYIGAEDPKRFFFEHVLTGDTGDGIPNILSQSDSFVNKIRQKPMTKKKLDEFWENKNSLRDNPRFLENLKLIDLQFTPKDIQEKILSSYETYEVNDKTKLRDYFIAKRMKRHYELVSEFL